MADITPAILPQNYEDLKNKIALSRNVVSLVQVDICDGAYVKNKTWPFTSGSELDDHFLRILNEMEGMPFWEDIDFELDLMVSDAIENFDVYTKLGPKSIIFHLGAVGDISEFKNFLEGIDMYIREIIDIGVAIDLDFMVEDFTPLANNVDFVQVMGISHIGFQGEKFNSKSLSYVKKLKEKYPDLPVSVDGGVNLNTAPEILSAGADRLIIGSAIFNAVSINSAVEEFRKF